jgi:hypothetical protein
LSSAPCGSRNCSNIVGLQFDRTASRAPRLDQRGEIGDRSAYRQGSGAALCGDGVRALRVSQAHGIRPVYHPVGAAAFCPRSIPRCGESDSSDRLASSALPRKDDDQFRLAVKFPEQLVPVFTHLPEPEFPRSVPNQELMPPLYGDVVAHRTAPVGLTDPDLAPPLLMVFPLILIEYEPAEPALQPAPPCQVIVHDPPNCWAPLGASTLGSEESLVGRSGGSTFGTCGKLAIFGCSAALIRVYSSAFFMAASAAASRLTSDPCRARSSAAHFSAAIRSSCWCLARASSSTFFLAASARLPRLPGERALQPLAAQRRRAPPADAWLASLPRLSSAMPPVIPRLDGFSRLRAWLPPSVFRRDSAANTLAVPRPSPPRLQWSKRQAQPPLPVRLP